MIKKTSIYYDVAMYKNWKHYFTSMGCSWFCTGILAPINILKKQVQKNTKLTTIQQPAVFNILQKISLLLNHIFQYHRSEREGGAELILNENKKEKFSPNCLCTD